MPFTPLSQPHILLQEFKAATPKKHKNMSHIQALIIAGIGISRQTNPAYSQCNPITFRQPPHHQENIPTASSQVHLTAQTNNSITNKNQLLRKKFTYTPLR
jgi:acyl-CoA hydrolase